MGKIKVKQADMTKLVDMIYDALEEVLVTSAQDKEAVDAVTAKAAAVSEGGRVIIDAKDVEVRSMQAVTKLVQSGALAKSVIEIAE